ncbi:hypothetical protein NP493_243g00016 [Ridgeia piscesae]|uniref:Uncharacterized protein n=1 Tax=Ridgeia piscesae TaxID=27915 RepID=A0AAD9UDD5_RIDPI|nr:hypothetical protein NP493_243g00016 [Ridgeia piscesae]
MGDSFCERRRTLSKGEDVVVCLPGGRIEHGLNGEKRIGAWPRGSILVHVGTNNETGVEQPG